MRVKNGRSSGTTRRIRRRADSSRSVPFARVMSFLTRRPTKHIRGEGGGAVSTFARCLEDSTCPWRVRVWSMRKNVVVDASAADRARLEAVVTNRNSPQKHVWRARIVLLTADGLGTVEIMRRTGKSKTCVWRWQERFAEEGADGLLRDKTRPSRVKPLGQEVIDKVVALTATEPPHEATHWTGVAMATATRISVSS